MRVSIRSPILSQLRIGPAMKFSFTGRMDYPAIHESPAKRPQVLSMNPLIEISTENNSERSAVTEGQIRAMLHGLGIAADVESVGSDDSLYKRALIDSLSLLSVVEAIQASFDVIVPEQDLLPRHFDSVAAMARYVNLRRIQQISSA